ncbi:MAG: hypothetical protein M3362_06320, partial [Acidobacteriota bacterium]|nr:hypothetical protein [Acidobacteriota bacterium]
YILATLLLFIPVAARAAERFTESEERPRFISAGMQIAIALSLLTALLTPLSNIRMVPSQALKYLRGQAASCDLAGGECPSLVAINEQAGPGERVFLGTFFSYWLRPDLLQCMSNSDEKAEMVELETPELRWSYLYDEGFRFVVIDETTRDKLDPAQAPPWLKLVPLVRTGSFESFRLESLDSARTSRAVCQQTNASDWGVTRILR